METKIQKWGNSNGVRIPNSMLKSLGIKTDDIIDIELVKDTIVISKPRKHITFEERAVGYSIMEDNEEYGWGDPQGKELW